MKKQKKILIINAHPYENSFCNALAQKYYEGSKQVGYEVKIINLRELDFDPILHYGYSIEMPLEKDLKEQQELIEWCNHFVLITPLWWESIPALLKGYFERVFLPGFAFKYMENSPIPKKLLKEKSASVIYTQGAPFLYSYLLLQDCFWRMLKGGILSFCGFNPVRRFVIDSMSKKSDKELKIYLEKIYKMGKKGF